jgi:hypothetical protein
MKGGCSWAVGRSKDPRRRSESYELLGNHAFRISLDGEDALHAKNVLSLGAKEPRKPFVEFLCIAVPGAFDADASDSVVMMMVMMLVLFLEGVRVDFIACSRLKPPILRTSGSSICALVVR